TARELEALGHRVEAPDLPLGVSWEALVAANATIWCATLVGWIDAVAAATGRPIDATTLEPATLACYRHGREASATSFAGFGVQLGVSRSVRDSAALLDAIQGHAPGDPYVTAAPARNFLSEVGRDPGRLTIAMRVDPWNGARTDPAIAAATRATARELEALGHRVEAPDLPLGVSWEALVAANATIWCATLVGWIDAVAAATGRPIDATTLEPATLACYRHGREASATSFAAALDLRNRLSREVGGWFERFDLLMTPTLPRLPPAIGTYARGAESMTGLEWTARVFEHSPFTP
ncbi:amidase family protein, partial [Burkholderia gladioli]|nr:amidase family protein [Burkholderia gladioli]